MRFVLINNYDVKENLSWIICKNPANEYKRDLNGKVIIEGKFINNDYYIYSNVDSQEFIVISKGFNLDRYLHPWLGAVTPYVLRGVEDCLRSAINGKNDTNGKLTDSQVNEKVLHEARIGPLVGDVEKISEAFNSVGIHIVSTALFENQYSIDSKLCYDYHIQCSYEMSLSEFLQKVLIISLYLSVKYNFVRIETSNIEKLIKYMKNWIINVDPSFMSKLLKSLMKFNKGLINTMVDRLNIAISNDESIDKKDIHEEEELIPKLVRETLHQKRHNMVLEKIIKYTPTTMLDIGAASGQMYEFLRLHPPFMNQAISYTGLEVSFSRVQKNRNKFKKDKNANFICTDVLYPSVDESLYLPDMMTAIEIIEHMHEDKRKRLIELVLNLYVPKYFILTTPNVDYNKNYNIPDGQYRIKSHKIEYNKEQFEKEVVIPLSKKYNVEYVNLLDEEEQPTFCIFCTFKEDFKREVNKQVLNQIKNLYTPIYLPITNYTVSSKELSTGLGSRSYSYSDNIFYLAPNIAPVEYNDNFPEYLEHPVTAVNYYLERGITQLVAEHKYMGSRCYIIIFKQLEHAKMFGFNHNVTIFSRRGHPFLKLEDISFLDDIYNDIKDKLKDNGFVILDGEFMPWSYKSGDSITHDFVIPAQACGINNFLCGKSNNNVKKYFKVLSNYINNDKKEIRAFHVLATGNVHENKKKFIDVINGFHLTHTDNFRMMSWINGDIIKSFDAYWYDYDTNSLYESNNSNLIRHWEEYCDDGGEGFVIKPKNFISHTNDGFYIQPALKVRGREYLRMVYGIDYTDHISLVGKRNVKSKRLLAIQQFELSYYILNSFLRRNEIAKKKFVSAFLGVETINGNNLDATL